MLKKIFCLILFVSFLSFAGQHDAIHVTGTADGTAKVESPGKFDLIIVNGTIIDGSGAARFAADLGIKNGKIKEIGSLKKMKGSRIINAAGLVVTPGFIESHSNDRPNALVDNTYALSMVHQGVTSLIMGEQGFAPSLYDPNGPFATLEEGFQLLMDHGIAVNYGAYIDQMDARIAVMGFEDGEPTAGQLEVMKAIVAQAMESGAFGLSSALVYAPGSYSSTDTVVELAKVAAAYGGNYKTHVRGEDKYTLDEGRGIREAMEIGARADIPVVINHMKAPGVECYELEIMQQIIDALDEARAAGQDISAQMYPYDYGITSMNAFLPPWRLEGGKEAYVARLQDPETRAQIRKEIYEEVTTPPFFNFVMVCTGGNWAKIKLTSVVVVETNLPYVGKNFYEIAEMMGYDIVTNPKDTIEAFFDLIISEYSDDRTSDAPGGLQPMVIVPAYYSEDDLRLGLQQPWVGVASDGFAQKPGDFKIHPRCFGTYPRVLGHYSRDEGLFTLEEAVKKMTWLPAQQVGLKKRGRLAKGYAADITIFNPETVEDLATYIEPNVYPAGIIYVIVNGELVIDNAVITGALPGQILRKKVLID